MDQQFKAIDFGISGKNIKVLAQGTVARTDEDLVRPKLRGTSLAITSIRPVHSRVVPWFQGANNMPEELINLASGNPILLGLLLTKAQVLHGSGLCLHTIGMDGEVVQLPRNKWPEEIRDFFDYNQLNKTSYLLLVDYLLTGNAFMQMIPTKGSARHPKKIIEVTRIQPGCVRILRPENGQEIQEYVVAGEWQGTASDLSRVIPAFRRKAFFQKEQNGYKFKEGSGSWTEALLHIKVETTGYPYYGIPFWRGAADSVRLQNVIPHLHLSNLLNGFGARVSAQISDRYINTKRNETNPETNKAYSDQEIIQQVGKMIQELLTRPENVGKTLVTGFMTDHQGKRIPDIVIEKIAFDFGDKLYTKLEPLINEKVSASVGLLPHLSGLFKQGSMSSGSEIKYAWEAQKSLSSIDRSLILEPLNFILRYNGFGEKYFWDFPIPSIIE